MKIALFSRSIYPRTGGSSFVTEQLSMNFARGELFVVGGRDVFFSTPKERPDEAPKFYYLPSQLSLKGRGERFFEWFRYLLFPLNLIQALIIVGREKPDVVVCVFPDAYFCWLGLMCSWFTRKPYFTYFHNTYKENRTGFDAWMAEKIQHIFFKNSQLIFVMSDGLRRFYERQYSHTHKFRTLPHTFRAWPDSTQPIDVKGPIHNVAFTGNFNDSNMDATIRVVNSLKTLPQVRMNFYTPVPKALLKIRGLDVDAINYVGYLPENDYRHALAQNEIMILTHGFKGGYSPIEYETIFPTRTIELFLTGKPVFGHAPVYSFLAEYLQKNACATVVTDPDESKIRGEFVALLNDPYKQSLIVENAQKCLLSFYGPNVIDTWRKELSEFLIK